MSSRRVSIHLWQAAIFISAVLVWEYGTQVDWLSRHIKILDPFFISTPSRIYERFFELSDPALEVTLIERVVSTLTNTILGFVVGVSTGFVAGLYLGRDRYLAAIFEPFIVAFNSLPRIALVPLVTLLFGFGTLSKVVMAWLIVFFIVFFNTFEGVKNVDRDIVNSARMLGATRAQILRTVYLPAALGWTFASLTPAISFALIGVVIGEFLGGDQGIGYLIILSLATLESADMMVALIVLSTVGIILALGVRKLESYLLRWQPRYYVQADGTE
jgi:NitT/TauT family transport system permease protein